MAGCAVVGFAMMCKVWGMEKNERDEPRRESSRPLSMTSWLDMLEQRQSPSPSICGGSPHQLLEKSLQPAACQMHHCPWRHEALQSAIESVRVNYKEDQNLSHPFTTKYLERFRMSKMISMQLILSDLSMSVGQSSLFGHSSNQEEGRAQSCTMAEKLSNKSKKTRPLCKLDAPTALAPQHA